MNFAITIAGSDSIAGAGIQEDLKTCTMLGVYCATVITSVTAQNSYEVRGIHDIPPEMVELQIDTVLSDIPIKYGKTGMLSNANIIEIVSKSIKKHSLSMVVDPVMVSKSGSRLLREDAVESLIKDLIPISFFVTPNIPEAEVITGLKIKNDDDMFIAAKEIKKLGVNFVVVKGGHMDGKNVTDVLYDGKEYKKFVYPRIRTKNTHGSGCTLSSAISSYLAKGYDPIVSYSKARSFLQMAIEHNLEVGRGHGPLNPMYKIKFQ